MKNIVGKNCTDMFINLRITAINVKNVNVRDVNRHPIKGHQRWTLSNRVDTGGWMGPQSTIGNGESRNRDGKREVGEGEIKTICRRMQCVSTSEWKTYRMGGRGEGLLSEREISGGPVGGSSYPQSLSSSLSEIPPAETEPRGRTHTWS